MDQAADLNIWIQSQNPPALVRALELSSKDSSALTFVDELKDGGLRKKAMIEKGFAIGAQTALAWRYEQIRDLLISQEGTLDRIMSFSPFVVDQHMLLPSITEVMQRYDLSDTGREVRSVSVQYVLNEEARAISTTPTWREYMWKEYSYPEAPHPMQLPQNPSERSQWEEAVLKGWRSGLEQAQANYEHDLNTLVMDIQGRIRARILIARGIVSPPTMSQSGGRITQEKGGQILSVGDTVYSITVPTRFANSGNWAMFWRSSDTGEPSFSAGAKFTVSSKPVFSKE